MKQEMYLHTFYKKDKSYKNIFFITFDGSNVKNQVRIYSSGTARVTKSLRWSVKSLLNCPIKAMRTHHTTIFYVYRYALDKSLKKGSHKVILLFRRNITSIF